MPTKAQLLELNKSLIKERDQLRVDKKQLIKDLVAANGKIKFKTKSFNELQAGLERAKLDNQNHVEDLSDLRVKLANIQVDVVRFKKRIPWWKSKK